MKDYINIKIGGSNFIQRNEFSKLLIFNDDGTKETVDNLDALAPLTREILEDALKIQKNPKDYFEFFYIDNETNDPNFKNEDIVITNYIGTDLKNVIIPSEIDGHPVKALSKTFKDIEYVERIYMPNSIIASFGELCANMVSLKHIHLSSQLNIIGSKDFANCENLKSINLENVKKINFLAFNNCETLNNIDLNNITNIGDAAFAGCIGLSEIHLPNICVLGDSAFKYCENLKTVSLNDELEIIYNDTFERCYNLSNIKLPNKLETIGRDAFYQCKKLSKIDFPKNLTYISSSAFYEAGLEGEITFPKSLTEISNYAFQKTKITAVNISKNTRFKNDAFSLDALVNLHFYDSIKTKFKNIFKNKER